MSHVRSKCVLTGRCWQLSPLFAKRLLYFPSLSKIPLSLFFTFLLEVNPKVVYLSPVFPPNCLPWEKEKASFFLCFKRLLYGIRQVIHPPPSLIPFITLRLVAVGRESVLFVFLHYIFFSQKKCNDLQELGSGPRVCNVV